MNTWIQISGIAFLLLCSCANKTQTAPEILSNEQLRNEIMETVSNDEEMLAEMMSHIIHSDHSVELLQGNRQIMHEIMANNQMMGGMMQKDTVMAGKMMERMMGMMAKDSSFCKMMSKKMSGNNHMMGMMKDSTTACTMHHKKTTE